MLVRRIAKPLDAISEDRYRCVADCCTFHCPACIADHDLIQRETFFRASDEDMSRYLGNFDHDPSFPEQKFVGWRIVHDPGTPGHRSIGQFQTALEQKPGIPDLRSRMQP